MIAPIDGSDPPERPLTPASFDSRNRSIRAKSSRGCAQAIRQGMRQGVRQGVRHGMRQRQMWGCDSDRAITMTGMGPWP